MAKPHCTAVKIQTTCHIWNTSRIRIHKNCFWCLREGKLKVHSVCDPTDSCIISYRGDNDIQVPLFGVPLNIVAEPGNNGVVVPLSLAIGLRVVRFREDVCSPQELADVMKEF